MVDIGFPELLTLVQTIAIIMAIVIAVYFSRLQIQALKTDTEARVVNDLDEKLHRIGEIFMEKPEFVRILNDDAAVSNFGAEVAFAFYVMFFCSHCYHMRQRGILTDNDWAGWLQWTKNAFRSGRLGKYWKEAEMQAWVDPAFREFVNREILGSTIDSALAVTVAVAALQGNRCCDRCHSMSKVEKGLWSNRTDHLWFLVYNLTDVFREPTGLV